MVWWHTLNKLDLKVSIFDQPAANVLYVKSGLIISLFNGNIDQLQLWLQYLILLVNKSVSV